MSHREAGLIDRRFSAKDTATTPAKLAAPYAVSPSYRRISGKAAAIAASTEATVTNPAICKVG